MDKQLGQRNINVIYSLNFCLVVLLCLLFVIIPQTDINEHANSTIISKLVYFLYGCSLIFLILLAKLQVPKSLKFSFTKMDIGLLLLLVYISLNRYVLQSIYGFSIRYIELLGLSFLYFVLRILPLQNFYWLLLSVVVSGIIQAIYGNLQLFGYYPSNHSGYKMTGSFFNPGPFAGFLATVWSIALSMYLFRAHIINQVQSQFRSRSLLLNNLIKYSFEYVPLLGIVSILLVMPSSQSRASWLAVMVSTIVLLEYKYTFYKKVFKKISALKKGLLLTFTLIVLGIGLFGVFHFKKASASGRLFVWKVTTEMIKDTPVFGVGFDRFKAHYMNYQSDYFEENGETKEALMADNTYYAFNEFVQFFSENGALGVLLLTLVIYVLIKSFLLSSNKILAQLAFASILVIAVFACFSYPMQILPIKLILTLVLSLIVNLDTCTNRIHLNFLNKRKDLSKLFRITILIGGIFLGSKYAVSVNKLSNSFKKWQEALNVYNYGAYEASLSLFTKADTMLNRDGDFLMTYGKALSMAKQNKQAVKVLKDAELYLASSNIKGTIGDAHKGLKQYEEAEKAYKKSYNMVPSRFYPQYLLAKLYEESDDEVKAINIAKTILNKKVKIPSTAITEIKREMKKVIEKYKTSGEGKD